MSIILQLAMSLGCAGFAAGAELCDVKFEWFNLSTNEIWVTSAVGLPSDATPGRLMPSREENMLESSTSVFSEAVKIRSQIALVWKDNGKDGWPGGSRFLEPLHLE